MHHGSLTTSRDGSGINVTVHRIIFLFSAKTTVTKKSIGFSSFHVHNLLIFFFLIL